MKLVTLPNKIVHTAQHTLLVMKDDETSQVVCVVAPDRKPSEIQSQLPVIEMVASRKLMRGDLAFDGRVWVIPDEIATAHPT
ncbi:hypothetical protein [Oryzifoliimicrobium ureilyticus]|uniref:hypothetical protein n=1 Tax=Oryzifoliimicrobium ureilyticus TaxID=3113724 RepID=UPI00307656C7